MKSYLSATARILFGIVFFVFGLNVFLDFLPMPPMQGRAGEFVAGLAASGYVFPLMGAIETLAGAALLIGRFVPLALTVLAPVVVNVLATHLFLAPSGIPHALALLALELYLVWSYRAAFEPLLRAREVAVGPLGRRITDAHAR